MPRGGGVGAARSPDLHRQALGGYWLRACDDQLPVGGADVASTAPADRHREVVFRENAAVWLPRAIAKALRIQEETLDRVRAIERRLGAKAE